MEGGARGKSKLLERAQQHVEQREYYEAHQLYKGQVSRSLAQRKVEHAIEVAEHGVKVFGSKDRNDIAMDLATWALDVLTVIDPKGDLALNCIVRLANSLAHLPTRLAFYNTVVQRLHSLEVGSESPSMVGSHEALGDCCMSLRDYPAAQLHYAAAGAGKKLFAAVQEWSAGGLPAEWDLFVFRAFLLLLTSSRSLGLPAADDFLYLAQKSPPATKRSPLLHLAYFILVSIQRQSTPFFDHLATHYTPALNRDPALKSLMDKVKAAQFGKGPCNYKGLHSHAPVPVTSPPQQQQQQQQQQPSPTSILEGVSPTAPAATPAAAVPSYRRNESLDLD